MASGVYNHCKTRLMAGDYQLASGGHTIKVALMATAHTFNPDYESGARDSWSEVSANEMAGTGYTAGGATLGSQTVTADDVDDEGVFDGADTAWTSATFNAYHAVLYDDTVVGPPADILICSIDFGGVKTVTAGTFTIQWAAEGIINIG